MTTTKTTKRTKRTKPAPDAEPFVSKGTVYKVWIDIEAYDVETGEGQMLDVPLASTATFRTAEEALAVSKEIHATFGSVTGQVRHL